LKRILLLNIRKTQSLQGLLQETLMSQYHKSRRGKGYFQKENDKIARCDLIARLMKYLKWTFDGMALVFSFSIAFTLVKHEGLK